MNTDEIEPMVKIECVETTEWIADVIITAAQELGLGVTEVWTSLSKCVYTVSYNRVEYTHWFLYASYHGASDIRCAVLNHLVSDLVVDKKRL